MVLPVTKILALALTCALLSYAALRLYGCDDGSEARLSEELRYEREKTEALQHSLKNTEADLESAKGDLYVAMGVASGCAAALFLTLLLLMRVNRSRRVLERFLVWTKRRKDDG